MNRKPKRAAKPVVTQVVCQKGHYHLSGVEESWLDVYWECPDCGSSMAWSNPCYHVCDVIPIESSQEDL